MVAKTMPAMDSLKLDRDHYYQQPLTGFYRLPCTVRQGEEREAAVYIPENSEFNQPTVMIFVPEGVDLGAFLEDSGWAQAAEEEKLYLVILEPEQGVWKGQGEERAYVDSVLKRIGARPLFCPLAYRIYGAGYGAGADVLMGHMLRTPQKWAGVLLAGPAGLTEEEAEELRKTPTSVPGVNLSQVQMPAWIAAEEVTPEVKRLMDYLREANHSQQVPQQPEPEVLAYMPEKGGTLDEHWCAPVYFSEMKWKNTLSAEFGRMVYRRLWKGTGRYGGNGNGALRHNGDIRERGFKRFAEKVPGGYGDPETDYYRREWWIYEPKEKPESGRFPTVFLFHGAGGSADEIGDRSGWAELAEKEGILLVCPGASVENVVRTINGNTTNNLFRSRWNTGKPKCECPGDMVFLDYLYQWVSERYPVDRTRVYATGQSSGGMMAWACAAYRPDYFAAAAPVSAKNINKIDGEEPFVEKSPVPVMAFLGVEDRVFPGGFGTEDAGALVNYWCGRYHTDRQWGDYTYMGTGDRFSSRQGLLTNYVFKTESGVPMLHLAEVETKTHAVLPSECRMIWEEWFSRFTKDEDTKALRYQGKLVEF